MSEWSQLRAMLTPPNPVFVIHEPRRPQLAWPIAPIPAAIRAVVAVHAARLYGLPPGPDIAPWIALLQMEADVADFVRDHDRDEVTLAGIRTLAGAR